MKKLRMVKEEEKERGMGSKTDEKEKKDQSGGVRKTNWMRERE